MTDSTIKHIGAVFPITSEALQTDIKYRRRRSIIQEFSLNTSTHGIPGIARSRSVYNRIFWTISFLFFTGVMIFFITQSIQAYFGYPTQTSVSFVVQRSQAFPAVSVCNYAPVRYDLIIDTFLNYTNSRGLTNTTDNSTMTAQQASYIRDFLQYIFNSEQDFKPYLFSLQSMLLNCVYNGQYCNYTDFTPFISSTYGFCYTFNAKMKSNGSTIRQTTDNGGSGKLELGFYAQSQQYFPYVSADASVGMMIMVHDNTELPLIEVAGIELAGGRKHKIGYKKRISQLLPPPYSDCTNNISPAMQAMYDRFTNADYTYSQAICTTICIQTYVYQECNCVNPNEVTARTIVIHGTNQLLEALLCNQTDTCFSDATNRITNTDSIWNEFCSECSQACSFVDFTITTSSVSAISTQYAYKYKPLVEQSGVPLPKNWSEIWQTEMQKNYIGVDIVSESTRVEAYTQDASITAVDLISNIGGNTGLWIGISFLSLMELIEMFYRLIRYHCYIFRRRVPDEHNAHL
ncbi:unnamed protein product [Adineta steineri]|uniref:Uncharacterized protein n=2 Tax=Adineta steineri TaxID=433720 RepID=A0A815XMK3_9BILA|nr:unnamed protein product [Adineta steineri]CAF1559236.1 unnamed protein product [Adineta steineri]